MKVKQDFLVVDFKLPPIQPNVKLVSKTFYGPRSEINLSVLMPAKDNCFNLGSHEF